MDALSSAVIVCLVSVPSLLSLTSLRSVSFKSGYTHKDTSTELNAGVECGMSAFIFAYTHPPLSCTLVITVLEISALDSLWYREADIQEKLEWVLSCYFSSCLSWERKLLWLFKRRGEPAAQRQMETWVLLRFLKSHLALIISPADGERGRCGDRDMASFRLSEMVWILQTLWPLWECDGVFYKIFILKLNVHLEKRPPLDTSFMLPRSIRLTLALKITATYSKVLLTLQFHSVLLISTQNDQKLLLHSALLALWNKNGPFVSLQVGADAAGACKPCRSTQRHPLAATGRSQTSL